MTEGLIIGMLLCVALAILAVKLHSLPVIFISSAGWIVCGLQLFEQTNEILPVLLIMMLAVSQFILINKEAH